MRLLNNTRESGRRPWGRYIVIAAVLAILFGGIGAYAMLHNLPDPSALSERTVAQSTKIYDRTGQTLLYEMHG